MFTQATTQVILGRKAGKKTDRQIDRQTNLDLLRKFSSLEHMKLIEEKGVQVCLV